MINDLARCPDFFAPVAPPPRREWTVAWLWREANGPLRWAAVISALAILPTLIALQLDPRVLDNETLWLKPLKFQISMGLLAATVALVPLAFSMVARRSVWVTWPAAATALAVLYELGFLAVQAARGVRSHFNHDTLFDALGGGIMAGMAGVLVTGPAILGLALVIHTLRWRRITPFQLSLGLGLIVGGVLAAYTGGAIGANRGPFVGIYNPDDPVLPLFGWSRTIGDLRISHFLGLHMMQVLPLVGWLSIQALPRLPALALVTAAAAVWATLVVAVQAVALTGLPLV